MIEPDTSERIICRRLHPQFSCSIQSYSLARSSVGMPFRPAMLMASVREHSIDESRLSHGFLDCRFTLDSIGPTFNGLVAGSRPQTDSLRYLVARQSTKMNSLLLRRTRR